MGPTSTLQRHNRKIRKNADFSVSSDIDILKNEGVRYLF